MTEDELNLLHRYLDGAITPEDLESLNELLRNSAEARSTLRSLATIDAKWQEIAAEATFETANESHGANRDFGTQAASKEPAASASPLTKERSSLTLLVASAIAIAASLLVGAFVWFSVSDKAPTETSRGIARVIRIEGQGKTGKDRIVVDKAELFAGEELSLQHGLIELAFRETGVHVIATAPLKMTLDSNQHVSLREGQVKLVVPPQGVGFVVDTAQRKFVDLGTSFCCRGQCRRLRGSGSRRADLG